MRSRLFIVLAALGSASCASPLAALPLAAAMQGPQTLAAPWRTAPSMSWPRAVADLERDARSMWRREASKACQGEYMVLSERDAQSQRGGVVGGRSYEGFVRCISAEGMGLDPDRVSKR